MEQEQLLRKIEENTRHKSGFDVILSSNTSVLETSFSPELTLNGPHKIAVDYVSTYNSIPNVTLKNFTFEYNNGTSTKTVYLRTGSYEIDKLNEEIIFQMKANGDYDTANDEPYITIEPNPSRLTVTVNVKGNYVLNLDKDTSIGPMLGFHQTINLPAGQYESPNTVNIIKVNGIIITCNLVDSTYLNGKRINALYSFPIEVSPGFRMVSHPSTPQYHKIIQDRVSLLTVTLTDESGDLLDLRGELITIRLRIEES